MALVAPIVIGCIDYLAYGTIFMRAMFLGKKIDVFFPARKAADDRYSGLHDKKGYRSPGTKTHICRPLLVLS
jgi:hypothetical protein